LIKKGKPKGGKIDGAVNNFVNSAFIRRTSKLGINFLLKENNILHFNMSAEYGEDHRHLEVDAQNVEKGERSPITHSEIRHLHRILENPNEHPNIDLARVSKTPDGTLKTERNKTVGNMPKYKAQKVANGKASPKKKTPPIIVPYRSTFKPESKGLISL